MKTKQNKEFIIKKRKVNIKANDNLMEEGIVLEEDEHKIVMLPLGGKGKPSVKKRKDKVKFNKFSESFDLEYEIKENGLKENIIIKHANKDYKYEFLLKLTNLKFDEQDNTFKDKETNKLVFKLLDLVMFDLNKEESNDILEEVTKLSEEEIKLTITPSKEWLNSSKRTFPVTLDPSIEVVEENIISMGTTNEEISVGYISGPNTTGTITIDIENIKDEINRLGLSRYKVLLKLCITNKFVENYCGYYSVYGNDITLFDSNVEFKDVIDIDITTLVKENLVNDINTISLEITNNTLNHISSTEFDEINQAITNDYIYIATPYYEDEEYHPKLTLEYLSPESRPEEAAIISYDLGKSGQTSVNLYDGSFIHEIPLASINENSLQADLNLVFNKRLFNEQSIDQIDKFIGKGFKTNMHQYLVKDDNFNPITGGRKITYVDGQGFTHDLIEKWYYEDSEEVKHFVSKDEVFLDDDGIIKVNINAEQKEVKYELESEEGLSYLSASSMYNYRKKGLKRFFVEFGYGRKEIRIEENKIKSVTYYYISPKTGNKVYVRPIDVSISEYGELIGPTEQPLLIDKESMVTLRQRDNGQQYYVCNYTYFTGEPDGESFGETSADVNIIEESTEIYEENDIYENENIVQLGNQIKEAKKAVIETQSNKNNILISYANCLQQYKFALDQIDKREQLLEAQEYIKTKQNWLKDKQLKFYREIGNDSLVKYVNYLKKDDKDNIIYSYNKDNLTFTLETSLNSQIKCVNLLNGFGNLFQYGNMVICDEQVYKEKETLQQQLSLEIQKDNELINIKLLSNQISLCEEQYANVSSNLDYYSNLLDKLLKQKESLIKEQLKQVNDYIIDKSGNMLAFNGFGQLIMLIDKYENKIEINYDENNEKIEFISTRTQTINFNYKDNNLLTSIKDQYGKVTSFKYYNDVLTTICFEYLNNQTLSFQIYNGCFDIADDLFRYLEIEIINNVVNSVTYYIDSSCQIGETVSYDEEIYNTIIRDTYEYKINKTLVTSANDDVREIVFDSQGQVLNIIRDKEVILRNIKDKNLMFNVSFDEQVDLIQSIDLGGEITESTGSFFVTNDYSKNKIEKHKLLGLVVELGDFNVTNNNSILSVKLSVDIDDGDFYYEEEYVEVENQILVLPFVADTSMNLIRGKITFSETINSTNLKGFKLVALTGSIYSYDNKDRLLSVETGLTSTLFSDFVNDKATKSIFIDKFGRIFESKVVYDSKDRLVYQEDSKGNVSEYFYDEKDNLIEERTYNKKEPTLSSVRKYSYDDYGNVAELDGVLKDKNGLKHNTKYEYVPNTTLVRKVSNSNQVKCYGYDRQTNELLSFSSNGDQVNNSNRFTYNYGLMTSMSHHCQSVKYTYDSLGRVTNVNLFGIEDYIKTSYYDNKLYSDTIISLQKASWSVTTYANGRLKIKVYDKEGRLVKLKDGDNVFYYTYDEEDRLLEDGITYYEYDDKGLLINKETSDTYNEYTYDEYEKLSQEKVAIDPLQQEVVTTYEYDNNDQVTSVTIDSSLKVEYERDCLNRIIKENTLVSNVDRLSEEYVYLQEEDNTTNLIKEHVFKYFNKVTNINTYEYDEHGNITSIEDLEGNKIRYTYDSLNRLVREDNSLLNKTITIKYDAGGNILFKKEYTYTLDKELGVSDNKYLYGYASNQDWEDQLVSFNGESVISDEYGRPLCYRNDTLTWNNLNQLVTYKKQNDTNKLNFVYNEYGIRIRKYNDDSSLDLSYVVDRSKVLAMLGNIDNSNVELVFRYSLDKLKGFRYNDIEYIYKRNIQGDITQIINSAGVVVAKYVYDAWGNHKVLNPDGTENTDSLFIGNINPFRYRGYLFDPETNLYYLNSRYYDPEVSRFISPDSIEYLDPESINGLNLYCYCGNNPVMYVDESGNSWNSFWKGVKNVFKVIAGTALFLLGLAITVFTFPIACVVPGGGTLTQFGISTMAYGGFMVGSVFDSQIQADMDKIGWNPFNTNESVIVKSNKVSFYKGVPVINFKSSKINSFSFYCIFLNKRNNPNDKTIKHEYGHAVQAQILGPLKYCMFIAIPSMVFNLLSRKNRKIDSLYYSLPWERSADYFGGVNRNDHQKGSLTLSLLYMLLFL